MMARLMSRTVGRCPIELLSAVRLVCLSRFFLVRWSQLIHIALAEIGCIPVPLSCFGFALRFWLSLMRRAQGFEPVTWLM
jgi:hypothetical protein